jgi:sugar phosphate isomerase/epimerase
MGREVAYALPVVAVLTHSHSYPYVVVHCGYFLDEWENQHPEKLSNLLKSHGLKIMGLGFNSGNPDSRDAAFIYWVMLT